MNQPRIFQRRHLRPRTAIETLETRIAPAVFNPLAATVDGAAGSLRDAIIAANANGENDIFNLGAGTYTLNLVNAAGQENATASGDLDLTETTFTFTFNGAGVGVTIIDQAAVDRVFQIFPNVSVSFNNLTIRGGEAVDDGTAGALPDLGDGNGGGILSAGNVTLTGASVIDNFAAGEEVGEGGGGIFNSGGTLTLTSTTISGNIAIFGLGNGGGIFTSGGTVNITGGAITANHAARAGGGIENNSGTVTLTDVTLGGATVAAGNTTGINGGGLHISGGGNVTINGGTVSNNLAEQEGGGLWNSSTGTLLVQASLIGGTTISLNTANGDGAEQGGGGIFSDGGSTTVTGATITNNIATASAVGNGGGGIFNDGQMTITNTVIANNFATTGTANGGGILNSNGGNLTITGSTISGNQAARAGGGIENNLGTLTLTDVTLGGATVAAGNTTGINGGGLHISGAGSVTINGGTVSNNIAGQEGGGLWNSSSGTLIVQASLAGGTTISSNIANGDLTEQGGGGIFSDGGNTTVTGATITNNGASASAVGNGGGGIFNDGPMTIANTVISNNFATNGMANGGGILNSNGGVLTVTGGTISNNQAARAGGGIENNGGMVTLTGVALDLNSAGVNGGGLHTSGAGVVTINGGSVRDNEATNEGGGLWNSSSGILNVNGTTVDGNEASTGAGVFGDGSGGAITVIASTISHNVAMNLGGGFSIEGGTLTIVNSTVSGNESTTTGGGGIFVGGGIVDIFNSTIVENNAVSVGAGGVEQGGGVISLFSTIVASNTRDGGIPIDVASSAGTINAANSLIENPATGVINGTNTANIFNDDPVLGPLQDNGGPTFSHALQIGSPAINAGSNVRSENFDQRGTGFPRVFGSRADIGAFEFTPPPIIAVGAGAGAQPRVTIFNAADGSVVKSFLAFSQNFRNGVTVATGDINGDGLPEVIVGRATGDSTVKVFDALTGENIDTFRGFAAAYRGGVHLATGDIDNDGSDDILVGKASGVAAIKVFSGETGGVLEKINPFPTAFRGGVTVASGDVNNDGFDDIIAGRAKGSKAQVRVFDGETGDRLASFLAFVPQFRGGVFVAAGDVTGDGVAEIIAGNGKGELPILHVLNPLTGSLLAGPGRDFLAFPANFLGGVRVAATDVNGDGIADIITAPGKGLPPAVGIFDGTDGALIDTFTPAETSKGIFVG